MTKKTIIFDTDDESKGHYPSDEAYAPVDIGKVYRVIEDEPSKSITLYPVDTSSNLPSMGLGLEGLRISKSEKDVIGTLLVATGSINGNNYKTVIQEDGDIIGDRWSTDSGGEESLSNYIQHNIGAAIENSVQGDLSSGWTRLNNGLLLQWGTVSSTDNTYKQITFPTAFTKTKIVIPAVIDAWNSDSFTTTIYLSKDDVSLAKQGFFCHQINGTAGPIETRNWTANWIAIGY